MSIEILNHASGIFILFDTNASLPLNFHINV